MTTARQSITLRTNIALLPGVGDRQAEKFRLLGLRCVADLLLHMPMRYEQEHAEQTIADAGALIGPVHGAEANIATRGEVITCRPGRSRKAPYEATLQ
ncbi:MAG: hypothetical protein O7G85_17050, partial [Planctomycetota bacterium]|nr:hypothetical protein [Planctomycetota bacterium]